MEEVIQFLQGKKECLMVDLAIHLTLDVEEARSRVEPLVAGGEAEIVWLPMKNSLRDLCSCDKQEVVRWRKKTDEHI